ncbi:MAG: hypothetical protein GY705_17715 [Bacteroidetes bacterium]|nr:hypothetical protein [Bacteroidota bacterium]
MNVFIPIIVISGFIIAIYLIASRSRRFKKCLTLNGFEIHKNYPEYIENICEELFDSRVRPGFYYRARIDSEWSDDAWVIDVDFGGGDDPSQQVLITKKTPYSFPEFALSLSDGITKINGLFKLIDRFENPFKKGGFHLLTESYQPFLQTRKGIIVSAKEDVDIRKIALPSALESLRSGGYGGAAFYKRRLVVWTFAESNPDKLFVVARELLKGLYNSETENTT